MLPYRDFDFLIIQTIRKYNLVEYIPILRNELPRDNNDKLIWIHDLLSKKILSILLFKGKAGLYIKIHIRNSIYYLEWYLSVEDFISISIGCGKKNLRGMQALKKFIFAITNYKKDFGKLYNLK